MILSDFNIVSMKITIGLFIYCALLIVVLIVFRIINKIKARKAIKKASENPVVEVIHYEDKKITK